MTFTNAVKSIQLRPMLKIYDGFAFTIEKIQLPEVLSSLTFSKNLHGHLQIAIDKKNDLHYNPALGTTSSCEGDNTFVYRVVIVTFAPSHRNKKD